MSVPPVVMAVLITALVVGLLILSGEKTAWPGLLVIGTVLVVCGWIAVFS